MDKTPVDLTVDHEFETQEFPSFKHNPGPNPFHNDDVIEIGHNYNLRCRLSYNLNRLKMILQEMEHDIVLSSFERK